MERRIERRAENKPAYTQEEYLELERKASYKSEYYNGEISALSGASWNHNIINSNFLGFLVNRLKGKPCRPFTSELRIHIPLNTFYTYPDIVVVCGKGEFVDNQFDTLLNPAFIAEILSPSTENYDIGKKFEFYRSIPSLKEYWTISSYKYHIQRYVKNQVDGTWLFSETTNLSGSLLLACLNFPVSVEEIYEGVIF